MDPFTSFNVHKIVSSLAIGWSDAYCTGASLLVCVVDAAVYFVIFPESGFEIITVDDACWTDAGGYAIFTGKIIETRGYHGETFINHHLWDLLKREGKPRNSVFYPS